MAEEKIAKFWCMNCRATMPLIVDGQHVDSRSEALTLRFLFGHCVKCSSPGLLSETGDLLDEWVWESGPQLYPAVRTLDADLPPKVDESFKEALKCESAGAWLATGVMVRRTLEAIGREFEPGSKQLFGALHAMKSKGLISDELAQWGDALRFIGNVSAHPTDVVVTEQDARDAVEFVSAIIQTIYVLRPKFQDMKSRREKGATTAQAVPEESPSEEG